MDHFIGGVNRRRPQPCYKLVTVFWNVICRHVLSRGSMHVSQWKLLLLDKIEKIGGDKVWLLKKVGIQKISTKFIPFWRNIFLNWSTILEGEEVNDATHVKCQPIWLTPSIKINGKVVLNEKWQEKRIFFINDIMKTNGNGLMSVQELGLKYQITNACMFYNSLLSCLPRFWKRLIQNSTRLLSVTGSNMEQFDKIRNCIKPCKTFYNIFFF